MIYNTKKKAQKFKKMLNVLKKNKWVVQSNKWKSLDEPHDEYYYERLSRDNSTEQLPF